MKGFFLRNSVLVWSSSPFIHFHSILLFFMCGRVSGNTASALIAFLFVTRVLFLEKVLCLRISAPVWTSFPFVHLHTLSFSYSPGLSCVWHCVFSSSSLSIFHVCTFKGTCTFNTAMLRIPLASMHSQPCMGQTGEDIFPFVILIKSSGKGSRTSCWGPHGRVSSLRNALESPTIYLHYSLRDDSPQHLPIHGSMSRSLDSNMRKGRKKTRTPISISANTSNV